MRKRLIAAIAAAAAVACSSDEPWRPRIADLRDGIFSPPTPAYSTACIGHLESRTLIRTEAEWQETWSALYDCVSPTPALPSVDFGREMLVVVSLGSRNEGASVAIRSAETDAAGVLQVAETEYFPCFHGGHFFSWPVAIARLPRTDAPAAFQREFVRLDCE